MDRNDGLGAWRNGPLQSGRIHGVSFFVNIDEHRAGAAIADRFRSRHEGARHGDDFIAGTDIQREQGEPESVRAVADTTRETRSAKIGKLTFEMLDIAAASERTRVNYLFDGRAKLGANRLVMKPQIKKRNLHSDLSR